MSTDTMCRVCLVNNLNLYSVRKDLQNCYEIISREKFNSAGYPLLMCYICLSVLRKCQKFMRTAQDTNMLLKQWFSGQNENKVLNARPLYNLCIKNETSTEIYIGNNPSIEISVEIKKEKVDDEEQEEVLIQLERINEDKNLEDDNKNSDGDNTSVNHSDVETSPIPTKVWIEETPSTQKEDTNKFLYVPALPNPNSSKNTENLEQIKPFSCNLCEYKCKKKYQLNQHMRLHTGDRTFSCEYCNYKCALKYAFIRHVRIHTGDKPFSCDHCDFKCTDRSNLNRHKQQIHTDIKPFSCHLCDYKCSLKFVLTNHLKKHAGENPFRCDVCDYKCIEKSNLTRHIKQMHSEKKPFTCSICGYKCALKFTLTSHIRTHTNDKPFSCNHCDYKCTRRYTLNKHLLHKHGGK